MDGARRADFGVEGDVDGALESSEAFEGILSLEIGNCGEAVPGDGGIGCADEVTVDILHR